MHNYTFWERGKGDLANGYLEQYGFSFLVGTSIIQTKAMQSNTRVDKTISSYSLRAMIPTSL